MFLNFEITITNLMQVCIPRLDRGVVGRRLAYIEFSSSSMYVRRRRAVDMAEFSGQRDGVSNGHKVNTAPKPYRDTIEHYLLIPFSID